MLYGVPEEPGLSLRVEVLTAAKTTSAEYYKHLLGWNRSALKVTLPIPASAARAVGVLCRAWPRGRGSRSRGCPSSAAGAPIASSRRER